MPVYGGPRPGCAARLPMFFAMSINWAATAGAGSRARRGSGHLTAKRTAALNAARAFVNGALSTYCFSLMPPLTTDVDICSHACRRPVPCMMHAVHKCEWPSWPNAPELCIILMFLRFTVLLVRGDD